MLKGKCKDKGRKERGKMKEEENIIISCKVDSTCQGLGDS